jgi:hypothetical protein
MKLLFFRTTFLALVLLGVRAQGDPRNFCTPKDLENSQCQTILTDNSCKLRPEIALLANQCQSDWKANHCDDFVATHPTAVSTCVVKSCSILSSCSSPPGILEHAKMCLIGGGESWWDLGKGAVDFLVGDLPALSVDELAKQKYFQDCTSAGCKRQMLGPFTSYFTNEEIEGHPEDKSLNPTDVANQVYLNGYSAATLYRKLLFKLKDEFKNRKMDEKFIPPWSDKPADLPLSINELIDKVLEKSGIKNTACLRPELVTRMRCYALLVVIDPAMAVGIGTKLSSLVRLLAKSEKTAGAALRTTSRARPAAQVANLSPRVAGFGESWRGFFRRRAPTPIVATDNSVWSSLRRRNLLINQNSIPGTSDLCGPTCSINVLQAAAVTGGKTPMLNPQIAFQDLVKARAHAAGGHTVAEVVDQLKYVQEKQFKSGDFAITASVVNGYGEQPASVQLLSQLKTADLTPKEGSFRVVLVNLLDRDGNILGAHATIVKEVDGFNIKMVDPEFTNVDITAKQVGEYSIQNADFDVPKFAYTSSEVPQGFYGFAPFAFIEVTPR